MWDECLEDDYRMIRQYDYWFNEYVKRDINGRLARQSFEHLKPKKEEEPFIVVYRSKPIRGTVLELIGSNPNYNWEAFK